MAMLTVTESAKAVGVARSTIYDKIREGVLNRNAAKLIDTADLLRVFGELKAPTEESTVATVESAQPDIHLTGELLDMVQLKDSELNELRSKLADTEKRLSEHREAARALMSPEDFKKREAKWQESIQERQAEIEAARIEADEIREREKQARAEITALENRGFLDRLFNRKPELQQG